MTDVLREFPELKDPRTGEEKEFPAKTVAVFRPAKPLKDALNDCDPLPIA